MLIVFDLDGTLADIEHRLAFVRSKPKNWRAFDAGISNDKVNSPVAEVFHSLRDAGHNIVFASGRSEKTREATVAWLDANGFWSVSSHLYMRKADDFRGDDIVKKEILDQITSAWGSKPDMVFDDRPRVVKMWRDNGIFVFDVYQGTEDF
jgi:hydroxymethylpyrimidine pyrophosphatase-like HAD family hydrolase